MTSVKPNAFLVGAARAGTSSLYNCLRRHPDVWVPTPKEPSFFVHHYGYSDWDRYLQLFSRGRGRKVIVDTSASYLAAPEAPAWIFRTLGPVKIIMVLRDPVHRAYSLYCWMLMEGYEWLPTFSEALREEERRFHNPSFRRENPEYFWDYMYYRSGLYSAQVARYLSAFGNDRVRIYLFEDLIRTPDLVLQDLWSFLEVRAQVSVSFPHENRSVLPRVPRFQHHLRKLISSSAAAPKRRGFFFTRLVRSLMATNKCLGLRPRLDPSTEEMLREWYRPDVLALQELTQRDLSHWLPSN